MLDILKESMATLESFTLVLHASFFEKHLLIYTYRSSLLDAWHNLPQILNVSFNKYNWISKVVYM